MVLDMARQIRSKIHAVEALTETTVETIECYCLVVNQENTTYHSCFLTSISLFRTFMAAQTWHNITFCYITITGCY